MTTLQRSYGIDARDPGFGALDGLQELATSKGRQETTHVSLALIWRQLVEGSRFVVDQFFTGTRCGLVLKRKHVCHPQRRLRGRRLAILESMLTGSSQKQIGIDLSLSASTIASNAKLALESLGVAGLPSRVHPLLMLAATSAIANDSSVTGSLGNVESSSSELEIVAIDRPDVRLVGTLPTAEWQVLCSLFEGRCHAEIAERRGTSERTVANQLAAVFRRMKVSGRSELIQRLFAVDLDSRPRDNRLAIVASNIRLARDGGKEQIYIFDGRTHATELTATQLQDQAYDHCRSSYRELA